jgi:hypothetical protein
MHHSRPRAGFGCWVWISDEIPKSRTRRVFAEAVRLSVAAPAFMRGRGALALRKNFVFEDAL